MWGNASTIRLLYWPLTDTSSNDDDRRTVVALVTAAELKTIIKQEALRHEVKPTENPHNKNGSAVLVCTCGWAGVTTQQGIDTAGRTHIAEQIAEAIVTVHSGKMLGNLNGLMDGDRMITGGRD